jgi:DNA-binding MarR family transcriptional regulator
MAKLQKSQGATSMLHLLHRASQFSEELFAKALESSELTARQLIVLEAVASEDKPSQTEICAKSGIDRSTLADMVRRLIEKGLLARKRTKEDARRYAVRLTDEGRKVLDREMSRFQDVDKQILNLLPAGQRQDFAAALQRIVEASEKSIAQ